jgi:hypothetical protein
MCCLLTCAIVELFVVATYEYKSKFVPYMIKNIT